MTIICITGQPKNILQEVEESLRIRGVNSHGPLHRDPSFDMIRWHDRAQEAFESKQIKATPANKDSQQGRLWEQLAVDLLLSNMESKVWGWAHAHAVHHLDFWATLESGMRFVLLCEERSTMIGRIIEEGVEYQHVQSHIVQWELAHRHMLRFHLRNPAISMMQWASDAQLNMGRLIQDVNQLCGIKLDATIESETPSARPTSALIREITSKILGEYSNTNDLEQEIRSVIGHKIEVLAGNEIVADQLMGEYRNMKDRSAELAEIKVLKCEVTKNQEVILENKKIITKIEQQYFDELKAKKAAIVDYLKLQGDSKLLLDHLNQLQEKFEALSLNGQQEKKQFEAEISSVREESARQVETSSKVNADLKNTLSNELLVNKKIKDDLDLNIRNIKEIEEKLTKENQFKNDLQSRLAVATDQIVKLEDQSQLEKTAKEAALKMVDDVVEENDLLLSQLHHVQEELEKYYLQHQADSRDHGLLQKRWQRALLKHPELQQFEVIGLVSENPERSSINWRLNHLVIQDEIYGPFDFRTVIEKGVIGFVFSKSTESQSTLKAWPLVGQDDAELTISPVTGADGPQKRKAAMLQLSASDWRLVQKLNTLLTHFIADHSIEFKNNDANQVLLSLKSHKDLMDQLPAWLKFDKVRLLGQQMTSQKLVLALQLVNVEFNGRWLDQVNFQLQLNMNANVEVGSLHFIFDESHSNTTFEHWQSNLNSSAGNPVMALEIKATGWDALLWKQLSNKDRLWIQNLVYRMPFMLQVLKLQGERIEKESSVWKAGMDKLINWSSVPVTVRGGTATLNDTQLGSRIKRGASSEVTQKTRKSVIQKETQLTTKKNIPILKSPSAKLKAPVVRSVHQAKKSPSPPKVIKNSDKKSTLSLKEKNKKLLPSIKTPSSKPVIKKSI